jgi:hypothetical protein
MRMGFDSWNPEYDCGRSARIGLKVGDGGKWVCDPKGLFGKEYKYPLQDCIVYSIGSNFDLSFELDFKKVTQNNCKIFTFDPTLKGRGIGEAAFSLEAANNGIMFKPWGLAKTSNSSSDHFSLRDIMKKLGHSKIDLLKIDCEGCEYTSFEHIFKDCERDPSSLPFSMLLIELHTQSFSVISRFFSGADKCGLRLYHKEPNHWGCEGYKCVEFSFMTEKLAFKSHVGQYCPKYLDSWEDMFLNA